MTWLDDLKPGDKVIRRGRLTEGRLVMVERVTKTQVIAEGIRYRKSDGRMVGGSWYNTHIIAHDDPLLKRKQMQKRVAIVGTETARTLTDSQLARIVAILDEPKADTP